MARIANARQHVKLIMILMNIAISNIVAFFDIFIKKETINETICNSASCDHTITVILTG